MKIIDKETGKRLKTTDPVKGNPVKEMEEDEHSPMNPPEAYSEEYKLGSLSIDEMPAIIQQFDREHKVCKQKVELFEKALSAFKEYGYELNEDINKAFGEFFQFFDNNIIAHNQKEEKILFGELHKKLVESGEHSGDAIPKTSIDLMEDDHIKFIQLGALTFNLLGLAARLGDQKSRMFTYDVAYQNGRELIEMLMLHIFREDNTLFPLAKKLISEERFKEMEVEMSKL